MEIGSIVLSLSGHDKASFFVVVGFERNMALIADGKERLLEKPKKKNTKHLKDMQRKIDLENPSNAKLRKEIKLFLKEEVI